MTSLSPYPQMEAALGVAAPFLRAPEGSRPTPPADTRGLCFVPHPQLEFVRGRITARAGNGVTVTTEMGEVREGMVGVGVREVRSWGSAELVDGSSEG